jgi:alkylated DNA repair protein alkB family protein 8
MGSRTRYCVPLAVVVSCVLITYNNTTDELSKRKFGEEQDVYVPWNLQQKFVSQSPDLPSVSHSVVDEGKGVIVYQRYCHLYQEGELEKLAGLLKGVELVRVFYDNSNWFVWLRKTAI